MKKELLNEIRRFNEIVNYNPGVGVINEAYGDKDLTGWMCIGEIDGCHVFFKQPENKLYIMVDPDYNEESSQKTDCIRYCTTNDGNGAQTNSIPQYYLESSALKIYPEYQNTKYGEIFLGKQKSNDVIEKSHQDFISRLNIDGDDVILHHNSSYRITDCVIRKGEANRWSNNSDLGIYFWASKDSGRDPSGNGQYTYYCKIPLADLYDQDTNEERTNLRQSMNNHPYVGQKWEDGTIVVTTNQATPIWFVRDNSNGKCFNAIWEEIENPLQ